MSLSSGSQPTFLTIPFIDENFQQSGKLAKLEVLKGSKQPINHTLKDHSIIRLIDVTRQETNSFIDLLLYDQWRSINFDKYDLLHISRPIVQIVEPSNNELRFRLVLDRSCDQSSVLHFSWQDRITSQPGKLLTLQSLVEVTKQ